MLFIGAHPDDETFFAAGTFARSVSEGHNVAVFCATRGGRGKTGDLCSPGEVKAVRQHELEAAMAAVGVTDITLLDYPDRELAAAPLLEMRTELTRLLRRFRPDIVITFDPLGGNAHPDHIAISSFASDAIAIAADGRWFPELGEAHTLRRLLWTPPLFIYKLPPERDLRVEPGFDFILDVERWRAQKEAAFRAHATQFPGLRRLFFDDENGRRTFHLEAFRFAAGVRPASVPSADLWENL